MEYDLSKVKRQLHRAGVNIAWEMRSVSTDDFKLKHTRPASKHGFVGKEKLLTTGNQLPGHVLNLEEQMHRSSAAANESKDTKTGSAHSRLRTKKLFTTKKLIAGDDRALAHCTRLMIAKVNKLKRRKAAARTRRRKAEHQGEQDKAIRPSKVTGDQNLTPIADRNTQTSALYIIKSSHGKGLGMFATKDIEKGTRILAEKPFFSLTERPVVSLSDPYAPNDISETFDRLPAKDKRKYVGLHCPERPGCSIILSIYEANCFEMESGTCICLDASRINHSCVPNAHYSWNSNIKRETLHAVKDIREGEEITVGYCPTFRTLEERKCDLEPYVFDCHCPACQPHTSFGICSQSRRQQMFDLDQEIADYQNDPLAARAEYGHCDERSATLRLVDLVEDEGLVYEKSMAYHDAAECALKLGLREKALTYASKELDVDLCCTGRDSPSYNETINFCRKIYFGAEEVLN